MRQSHNPGINTFTAGWMEMFVFYRLPPVKLAVNTAHRGGARNINEVSDQCQFICGGVCGGHPLRGGWGSGRADRLEIRRPLVRVLHVLE